MNKKILFAAPAIALGMGGLISDNTFAQEVSKGAELRNCISNVSPENNTCTLTQDFTITSTTNPIIIDGDREVVIDLAGHTLTSNVPFEIISGNLSIIGEGSVVTGDNFEVTRSDGTINSLFYVTGSDSSTEGIYSHLTIGEGVVASTNGVYGVRMNASNENTRYGQQLDLYGTINAFTAGIYINGRDNVVNNAPMINIYDNASIEAGGIGIQSTAYAHFDISQAKIQAGNVGIYMENGDFFLSGTNVEATAPDGVVISVGETKFESSDNASLVINGGRYAASGENSVFFQEDKGSSNEGFGPYRLLGNLAIQDGTFVADDLFNIGNDHYDAFVEKHSGAITGGTFSDWNEYNLDADLVANGYIKDVDYTGTAEDFKTVMTVVKSSSPVSELSNYKFDLSLHYLFGDYLEEANSLLARAQAKGMVGEGFEVLPEALTAYVYDTDGTQITELNDSEAIAELRVPMAMPELADNATRTIKVVSCHNGDFDDNFAEVCGEEAGEVNTFDAYYDTETGELVILNVNEFSSFIPVYKDEVKEAPFVPAEEESTAPTTPETGAETAAQASGVVASTLALCMLTGATIAAFIGRKLFRKK